MFLSGENIILLDEVESTNNYASQLVSDRVENGTVVLARFQNRGRGQAGNGWESESGKNLLMSMVLYPEFLDASRQFLISKIVSLALFDLLKDEVETLSVKWPNDLYIGSRKLAGILIEHAVKGIKLESTIVGIGLNLNQEHFESDAPNPVSLKQITGQDYLIVEIAKQFLVHFRRWYDVLQSGSYTSIDEAYFSVLFGKEEWRRYRDENGIFEGRITGVGEFGQLIIEDRSAHAVDYMFKSVEFLF
jgi:BirA family biotin operon repressor/biotin-[acetyl-CoA-carboxylase] ligase